MKLSWILWWGITVFWLILLLAIIIYSLNNGLITATHRESMAFIWLLIGLFSVPFLIQVIWLILNFLVKRNN